MSDPPDCLWDTSDEFHRVYAFLPKQEWLDDEEAWIDEEEPLPESKAPRRRKPTHRSSTSSESISVTRWLPMHAHTRRPRMSATV